MSPLPDFQRRPITCIRGNIFALTFHGGLKPRLILVNRKVLVAIYNKGSARNGHVRAGKSSDCKVVEPSPLDILRLYQAVAVEQERRRRGQRVNRGPRPIRGTELAKSNVPECDAGIIKLK